MHFEENEIYHVYNRGNDKQRIFFNENNYHYFLKKVSREWRRYCDIFCYCLMPNHFHFMLMPNKAGCLELSIGGKLSNMQHLSKTIGKTLSSYTKAINIQNSTTGNLFQKKTKAKLILETESVESFKTSCYLTNCFRYIHWNPKEAKMVGHLQDWPHSSWQEYAGLCDEGICNMGLWFECSGMTVRDCLCEEFVVDPKIIEKLF